MQISYGMVSNAHVRQLTVSLRTGKYFERIIKQLLNSAFVGYMKNSEFLEGVINLAFTVHRNF